MKIHWWQLIVGAIAGQVLAAEHGPMYKAVVGTAVTLLLAQSVPWLLCWWFGHEPCGINFSTAYCRRCGKKWRV